MHKLVILGLVLGLGAALLTVKVQMAKAHTGDLGWTWGTNLASWEQVEDDTNVSNGWTTIVSSAVSSWYNNTDLWTNLQPPYSGNSIFYFDGNYGNSGWYGVANVYSGGTLCGGGSDGAVTGYCNKTTVQADGAVIDLNNYYSSDYAALSWLKLAVATHELGHVFGLSHPNCGDNAVMEPAACYPSYAVPNTVQSHDAWHVAQLGY